MLWVSRTYCEQQILDHLPLKHFNAIFWRCVTFYSWLLDCKIVSVLKKFTTSVETTLMKKEIYSQLKPTFPTKCLFFPRWYSIEIQSRDIRWGTLKTYSTYFGIQFARSSKRCVYILLHHSSSLYLTQIEFSGRKFSID